MKILRELYDEVRDLIESLKPHSRITALIVLMVVVSLSGHAIQDLESDLQANPSLHFSGAAFRSLMSVFLSVVAVVVVVSILVQNRGRPRGSRYSVGIWTKALGIIGMPLFMLLFFVSSIVAVATYLFG